MARDSQCLGQQTRQFFVGAAAFGDGAYGDLESVSVASHDAGATRAWFDAHLEYGVLGCTHAAPTFADEAMAGLGARTTRTATDLKTGVRELGSTVRGTSTLASG